MSLFLSTLMVCYEQAPTSHYRVQKTEARFGLPFSFLRFCSLPNFHLRKVRDSNPRYDVMRTPHFECGSFDHSDNFPSSEETSLNEFAMQIGALRSSSSSIHNKLCLDLFCSPISNTFSSVFGRKRLQRYNKNLIYANN